MAKKQWFAVIVRRWFEYGGDVWLSVQDSADEKIAVERVKAVADEGSVCAPTPISVHVAEVLPLRGVSTARVEYLGGHIE